MGWFQFRTWSLRESHEEATDVWMKLLLFLFAHVFFNIQRTGRSGEFRDNRTIHIPEETRSKPWGLIWFSWTGSVYTETDSETDFWSIRLSHRLDWSIINDMRAATANQLLPPGETTNINLWSAGRPLASALALVVNSRLDRKQEEDRDDLKAQTLLM